MKNNITSFDATELGNLIITKQLSPVEVMQAHLELVEKINPKVNAIVTLSSNSLDKAKKS